MNNLVNQILDVATSSIAFITLIFILPPFLCLRFFLSSLNSIFSENVSGKVVLITGASSGIGEHLTYEYARRGARLALVARRWQRLLNVAEVSRYLGAPDVLVICADVSKVEDSKHFINETVNHFGRLDHLVNNAGISTMSMLEEFPDITNAAPVMETNFWGSVYSTHFAIPHLKTSRGKIIVTASSGAWLTVPRMAFYSASKAAVISFFETLRVELGGDIGITIVTPGLIESELTKGKILSKEGKMVLDQDMRDVEISAVPVTSAERCAKDIVDNACRGDRYLTVPSWMRVTILWKVFLPEVLEWSNRMLLVAGPERPPTEAPSKKILDLTGIQEVMYPPSIQ
ncbi:11-beta-hydroxysteroid dehydrogenase 1B-like [Chenopodium quinoa]|uniref:11-beta-hydroxysteroid dehydrogenase 1B-like n=1 Tax=Chenopodium quinoa TaxID=63459 RepID=UPI000B77C12A|nr:11-beta-hydroxysteroid dehydrogenase 1B-like [Chenopodium quinoa]